jgi:hypothetical protein
LMVVPKKAFVWGGGAGGVTGPEMLRYNVKNCDIW